MPEAAARLNGVSNAIIESRRLPSAGGSHFFAIGGETVQPLSRREDSPHDTPRPGSGLHQPSPLRRSLNDRDLLLDRDLLQHIDTATEPVNFNPLDGLSGANSKMQRVSP